MSNNQGIQQETNSMMIIDGLKLDRVTDSMNKIQIGRASCRERV